MITWWQKFKNLFRSKHVVRMEERDFWHKLKGGDPEFAPSLAFDAEYYVSLGSTDRKVYLYELVRRRNKAHK
jgi:hypothetical protein